MKSGFFVIFRSEIVIMLQGCFWSIVEDREQAWFLIMNVNYAMYLFRYHLYFWRNLELLVSLFNCR